MTANSYRLTLRSLDAQTWEVTANASGEVLTVTVERAAGGAWVPTVITGELTNPAKRRGIAKEVSARAAAVDAGTAPDPAIAAERERQAAAEESARGELEASRRAPRTRMTKEEQKAALKPTALRSGAKVAAYKVDLLAHVREHEVTRDAVALMSDEEVIALFGRHWTRTGAVAAVVAELKIGGPSAS